MLKDALDLLFTLEFLWRFSTRQKERDIILSVKYGISAAKIFIIRLFFGVYLLLSLFALSYAYYFFIARNFNLNGYTSAVVLAFYGVMTAIIFVCGLLFFTVTFFKILKKIKII